MTLEQIAAAAALKRALVKCANASLGVYVYDGGIKTCPQPEGRAHPEWDDRPASVCEELGQSLQVKGLDCDGGAGC